VAQSRPGHPSPPPPAEALTGAPRTVAADQRGPLEENAPPLPRKLAPVTSETVCVVRPPVSRQLGPVSDRKFVPGKYPTRARPQRCAASSPALCTRCPYSRTELVTGPSRSSPTTGVADVVSPSTVATPGVTSHT